jgi:hypothetical protein
VGVTGRPGRWRARLEFAKIQYDLGLFRDEKLAAQAVDAKRLELDPNAATNFDDYGNESMTYVGGPSAEPGISRYLGRYRVDAKGSSASIGYPLVFRYIEDAIACRDAIKTKTKPTVWFEEAIRRQEIRTRAKFAIEEAGDIAFMDKNSISSAKRPRNEVHPSSDLSLSYASASPIANATKNRTNVPELLSVEFAAVVAQRLSREGVPKRTRRVKSTSRTMNAVYFDNDMLSPMLAQHSAPILSPVQRMSVEHDGETSNDSYQYDVDRTLEIEEDLSDVNLNTISSSRGLDLLREAALASP